MNLYKQEDLKILEKEKKLYTAIYISSFALIFVTSIVGLITSSYYSQIPHMIICSIINALLFILMIFFMDKNRHVSHLLYEFKSIIDAETKNVSYKVISISDKPITLADGSMCYEVTVSNEENKSFIYLSEVFEKDILELDKTYTFTLAFDYIKEINYED